MTRRTRNLICIWIIALGLCNFVVYTIAYSYIGGDAKNGQIVDAEGRTVAGTAEPLAVPAELDVSQINIGYDGRLNADGAEVGQFRIVDFPDNEDQLVAAGLNCFRAPDDVKPTDVEDTVVRQGCQEASNVEMIDELVSMIMVTRTYEAASRG